ncbi:hypothetical protein D1872_292860 [compost metagenome]
MSRPGISTAALTDITIWYSAVRPSWKMDAVSLLSEELNTRNDGISWRSVPFSISSTPLRRSWLRIARLSGPFGSPESKIIVFICSGTAVVLRRCQPQPAVTSTVRDKSNVASCRTFPPALSQRPDSAVYRVRRSLYAR